MLIKFLDGTEKEIANLRSADLRGANLRSADLRGANLRSADLRSADLRGANLRSADLSGADLRSADLSGADLRSADLRGANLRSADLSGANLRSASMQNAKLDKAKLPAFAICPEIGSFVAWKKLQLNSIAKIEISEKAKRTSSLVGRKCRASRIKVLAIYNNKGRQISRAVPGLYTSDTMYQKGKYVTPDEYNDDIRVECTHGIHFFMTRKEADEYEG